MTDNNMNEVFQSKNTVKNGDIAGRDIIKYHNTGQLDAFFLNYLEETLAPKLNEEAVKIKDSIGSKLREIVNEHFLNSLKRDLEKENLSHHISVLKEHLKEKEMTTQEGKSLTEIVDRTEIFHEWVEGIERIPKEEEELSKIWEGWYIDYYEGKKTSELQFIFSKMKDLSSKEAITLLLLDKQLNQDCIDNERNKPIAFKLRKNLRYLLRGYVKLEERKAKYTYDQLLKKELIEQNRSYNRIILPSFLVSTLILVFIYSAVSIINNERIAVGYLLDSQYLPYIILLSICPTCLFYLFKRLIANRYQLTWIGEEIVSYAEKIKCKLDEVI